MKKSKFDTLFNTFMEEVSTYLEKDGKMNSNDSSGR
jgi:hypothetical protein